MHCPVCVSLFTRNSGLRSSSSSAPTAGSDASPKSFAEILASRYKHLYIHAPNRAWRCSRAPPPAFNPHAGATTAGVQLCAIGAEQVLTSQPVSVIRATRFATPPHCRHTVVTPHCHHLANRTLAPPSLRAAPAPPPTRTTRKTPVLITSG